MGYNTSFSLKIKDSNNDLELIELLRGECDYANYALQENGKTLESCKWYDHEDDLKSFSRKHPYALFILNGEGEESGDLWKLYCRNGKVHRAKAVITFEPFDESKLK